MKTTRRTPRRDTKEFAAKVANVKAMVVRLLASLGGFPEPGDRDGAMIFPTRHGVLSVTMHGTASCTIFSRFGEPERAPGIVSSSGKWNHHGLNEMTVAEIESFLVMVWSRVALPVKAREAGVAAARAWLLAYGRRTEVRHAGTDGYLDACYGRPADPMPASLDFELHEAYMSCYEHEAARRAEAGPGICSTRPPAVRAVA